MELFQLPPLYPPVISRSLPLDKNEDYLDILEIKKSFRNEMQASFYFVENSEPLIERYSDRYSKLKKDLLYKWQPDWDRLPKELQYFYEKDEKDLRKKRKSEIKPNLIKQKIIKTDLKKLAERIGNEEEIENEENEEDKEDKKSAKGSDDEDENMEDEENAEEEDIEEENDYIDAYFDNGENYGDDDGGGGDDDGPVY